jgi:dTDP-4-amino-4,6-dideoxygalactose transaminase
MSEVRKIPFFDYPRLFLDDREEILSTVEEVGRRGAFIMQKDLAEFETNLSSFTGAKHAVGVANATDGLELAWLAVGLNKGDEVIVSTHTMLATASAIVTAGGTPIPVEIGPDNLFMFKNNQCKPECCGASFSCGSGCVCTTAKQRDFIASRGGNRTGPTDL